MLRDKSYSERTLAVASSASSSQISFGETPIEAVRDFWNRRPCNVRHSPRPVGSREYFDEVEFRNTLLSRMSPPSRSLTAGVESGFLKSGVVSVPIR